MRNTSHRFAHVLRDNKGSLFPSQMIFFDVESDNKKVSDNEEEATLKFGYALYQEIERKGKTYVREEIKYFDVPADFFEWLYYKLRPRRVLYLVSSNIWFDLRVSGLLRLLLLSGFRCVNYFIKGLSQQFTFRSGEKKIICLNFQNFYRLSVKDIGSIIGRQKKEVDFKSSSRQDLKSYCREDVMIIKDAFVKWREFCEANDLGTFGKTLPSQAFNCYRHRFMRGKVYIHNLDSASELERCAYFGGRTECFYIGKKQDETLYYLDVNSFYPYVMRRFQYPKKLTYYSGTCSLTKLDRFLEDGCTIAEVNLTTDEPVYPVKFNYKTVFPVGTFDTFLCTEGLRRASKEGKLNRVWRVAHYESDYIFKDYVNYFWGLRSKYRDSKSEGWEYICKMFLNSLYGKFGQRNDEVLWERACDPEEFYREVIFHIDLGYTSVITRFGGIEREVKLSTSEALNSFVGIASHVTEYARLILWDYIKKAGRDNVFYCDTDSLIVNEKGKKKLSKLISVDKLGGFKLKDTTDFLHIRGAKDYIFGSESKTKGIRRDAQKIDEDTFRQVQFPGFLGEVRTGLRPTYRIIHVTKKLTRRYDKGEVLPTGKVVPFELKDNIMVE